MRAFALLALVVLLSGCGKELCVAGVGDCKHIWDKHQERIEKHPTTSSIVIAVDKASVVLGGKAKFTVSGGKAPYRWAITHPVSGNIGQIVNDGNDGVYTAPQKIDGTQLMITVRVTDGANATRDQNLNVTTH
jgi:hypothetical protein